MKNRWKRFVCDQHGMEFIDIAVIVAGSILILYAIYEIIHTINYATENSQMGILKNKKI